MNVNALNDLFRGLLRGLMAWPANSFRPSHQIAPTGTANDFFATVFVANVTPVVDPVLGAIQRWTDQPEPSPYLDLTVFVQQRLLVSVNFFRGDAVMNATTLGIVLNSALAIESMQQIGLGLIGCSAVRNLVGLDEAQWESRAQIDVTCDVVSYALLEVATYNQFKFDVSTESATSSKEIIVP